MGTDEKLVPRELLKLAPREVLGYTQMNMNIYRIINEENTNV